MLNRQANKDDIHIKKGKEATLSFDEKKVG